MISLPKYVHVKRILVAPLEGDGHLAVYPHSCLYPCRSGDKAHWRSCKCYYFAILLTHVVLLGYSSLVPKPLVQGYSCYFVNVCASCLDAGLLRRRVPSLSLTRAQEICNVLFWTNVISTLIKDCFTCTF